MSDANDDTEQTPLERKSQQEASVEAVKAAARREVRPHRQIHRHIRPQEMFAVIGGFGLYSLLFYTTLNEHLIHPVFPFAALVFFLYPFRKERVARRVMQLGGLTFCIWLSLTLSGVLFPFIISFIIAYLCEPLVERLHRRSIPRWATSLLIILGILGVYALIGILLVPRVVNQFQEMTASIQGLLKGSGGLLDREQLIDLLSSYGLSREDASDLVTNHLEPQIREVLTVLFKWFGGFIQNVASIVEGVFNLILIPVLTFYMLLDFRKIRIFVRSTLLQDHPTYVYYVKRVDTILSTYIRGIMLTSSMVGAAAVGILSAFNTPYSVVLGILTGVFNLIPTVGMFINLGVAMIIYIFAPGSFLINTIIMAATIFGLHLINGYLVEPRIIGDRLGVHPAMLIASLFIFSHFLGFVGLLIAVPTTAVILMFLKEWYTRTVKLVQPVYTTTEISTEHERR